MTGDEWKLRARCREVDPDLFYPEGPANVVHSRYKQAISVCARCEVRQDCYEFARDNNERDGIWGGHYAIQIQRAKRREMK